MNLHDIHTLHVFQVLYFTIFILGFEKKNHEYFIGTSDD